MELGREEEAKTWKRNYKDLKWTIEKKWIEMTKKLPNGHNIGGTTKQKRRKEHKQESNKN
jgi:hypothetical protein